MGDKAMTRLRLATMATCCLLLCPTLYAGTGTARIEDGVTILDFCVSIRFDASQAQIDFIEQVLERGSQVLADATDGKMRFGNVSIFENSQAGSEAEIWILTGTSNASGSHQLATLGRM